MKISEYALNEIDVPNEENLDRRMWIKKKGFKHGDMVSYVSSSGKKVYRKVVCIVFNKDGELEAFLSSGDECNDIDISS